jgi:very-short-patch-repair endonuclease
MDVFRALKARNGIVRVSTLRRSGVTEHELRQAVRAGVVVSVCRGWVGLPGADPMLIAAAKRGVVLSCVTLAARKDLWVTAASHPHVAAPPKSGHAKAARGVVHWSRPVFPRDPELLEDSIENALVLVARCRPYEDALATWESAMRAGMVDPDVLDRAPLPPAARRLMIDARPFADAGTETIFRTRMAWLNLPITPQVWIIGHRVDLLIGERLVVQIDGGHHVGSQRTSDIAHDAELMLRGYHVIRIGYDQLMNQWASVQSRILVAIAQRLHLAR